MLNVKCSKNSLNVKIFGAYHAQIYQTKMCLPQNLLSVLFKREDDKCFAIYL
jgi:hypothetical protein